MASSTAILSHACDGDEFAFIAGSDSATARHAPSSPVERRAWASPSLEAGALVCFETAEGVPLRAVRLHCLALPT